jgi:LacI family transcriptional regulator
MAAARRQGGPLVKRVVACLNTSVPFDAALWAALVNYNRMQSVVELMPWVSPITDLTKHIKMIHPAGVVGRITTAAQLAALRELGIPGVGWIEPDEPLDLPVVITDDFLVGRLAATHLLHEGHQHFAYVGTDYPWSINREKAFTREVEKRGFRVYRFVWSRHEWDSGTKFQSTKRLEAFVKFLAGMPKPAGILCCNDNEARWFIRICQQQGWTVPTDFGVVGVDNENVEDYTGISLTSIAQNYARIVSKVMEVLEQLMAGQQPPPSPILVSDGGLFVRASSNAAVVDDPQVSKALAYIKKNACGSIDLATIAQSAGLSVRMLQYRFKLARGRTPREEIMQERIQRANELLISTDNKIDEIARECGFKDLQGFYPVFRRIVGKPPGLVRSEHR